MNYKEYFNNFDDFDNESQKILQSSYKSLISEKHLQSKGLQANNSLQKTDSIPPASSLVSDITDWQTDEYINLELLVSKIKSVNKGYNNHILEYNPKDYASNTQNKSISLPRGNSIRLKAYLNSKIENVCLLTKM